jgi:hypothetical protein
VREIAIVSFKKSSIPSSDYYYDVECLIATRITEWKRVDDETFKTLLYYQDKYNYCVIEKLSNEKMDELIEKTVNDWIELVNQNAKLDAKRKKERELKKKNKDQLTIKKKKELYDKLKNELKL